MRFNLLIAEVICNMKKTNYPDTLKKDGVVKRCRYLPVWLQNAVYHRDKGRCQSCGTDLSRLTFLGEEIHYDHIVPLNKGGNNEPTNFQILCKKCNLEKSYIDILTSERYQTFW